ncbi:hypothetical protein [Castellaniella sp.]
MSPQPHIQRRQHLLQMFGKRNIRYVEVDAVLGKLHAGLEATEARSGRS